VRDIAWNVAFILAVIARESYTGILGGGASERLWRGECGEVCTCCGPRLI
jgi:hypothetical protein